MLIEADHVPLSAEEVDRYARWLDWIGEELSARLADLSTLDDDPERGRSIRAILQHVIGAESAYLGATFGTDRDRNALVKESEAADADLADIFARLRALSCPRLRAMTPDERALSRQAGQQLWTARKMVRRMLEHRWEHLREIEDRVAAAT